MTHSKNLGQLVIIDSSLFITSDQNYLDTLQTRPPKAFVIPTYMPGVFSLPAAYVNQRCANTWSWKDDWIQSTEPTLHADWVYLINVIMDKNTAPPR